MQLRALRPKEGAKLGQLTKLLEGRGWRSSLPAALPDALLLRLALDFRRVEGSFTPDIDPTDEDRASMAAAMYVVLNLLCEHPKRVGDPNDLSISDNALVRVIKIYQVGLEREIVARISGHAGTIDQETLADELVRCVNECH